VGCPLPKRCEVFSERAVRLVPTEAEQPRGVERDELLGRCDIVGAELQRGSAAQRSLRDLDLLIQAEDEVAPRVVSDDQLGLVGGVQPLTPAELGDDSRQFRTQM